MFMQKLNWVTVFLSFWVFLGWLLVPNSGWAGKYNPTLNLGDPIPNWTNLPGVDGKSYSLSDFQSAKVVVVVFTCNSCPYAVDYEDRLIALHDQFAKSGEVVLLAVNCNLIPEDSLENMKRRAAEKKFPFPYVFDESQQLGKQLGAVRTPEIFIFNTARQLAYMGAIDDNADAMKVTQSYATAAIEALLAGQTPVTTETPPVGCTIRYQRKQRRN